MISLFLNEPFVIAQITGSSREEAKPEAFCAFTAKSSPRIPTVFLVATLLIAAASSSNITTSSSIANIPVAIFIPSLLIMKVYTPYR